MTARYTWRGGELASMDHATLLGAEIERLGRATPQQDHSDDA